MTDSSAARGDSRRSGEKSGKSGARKVGAARPGAARPGATRSSSARSTSSGSGSAKATTARSGTAKSATKRSGSARKKSARRGALPAAPAAEAYARLLSAHPDAHCELDFQSPFQLLVATILSAQCTDVRVNMVTPALFAAYPDAHALAAARTEDVEKLIHSTGFFRSKTKSLIGMAKGLVERHGGEVPSSMEDLVKLPGVGRKTANVILGNAFGLNEGVVVDTHVQRVTGRLGLSHGSDPVRIERELMGEFPRDDWALLSHLLIFHGRRVCVARRPRCAECTLNDICPSAPIFLAQV